MQATRNQPQNAETLVAGILESADWTKEPGPCLSRIRIDLEEAFSPVVSALRAVTTEENAKAQVERLRVFYVYRESKWQEFIQEGTKHGSGLAEHLWQKVSSAMVKYDAVIAVIGNEVEPLVRQLETDPTPTTIADVANKLEALYTKKE